MLILYGIIHIWFCLLKLHWDGYFKLVSIPCLAVGVGCWLQLSDSSLHGLLPLEPRTGFFTWWKIHSVIEKAEVQDPLMTSLGSHTMSLLPYSVSQCKSQSQARLKKWETVKALIFNRRSREIIFQKGVEWGGYDSLRAVILTIY